MNASPASSSSRRSDRWIPYYFFLFFGVIALVDGVMVTLAIRTQSGVVTTHPYEKGLAYNRVVEAASAQDRLGWKGKINYHADRGTLSFDLRDAQGRALAAQSLVAEFTRPNAGGMDFSLPLNAMGETPVAFPAQGVWEVRVYATHDGQAFQASRRIVVE